MESMDNFKESFLNLFYTFGPKILGAILIFFVGLYVVNFIAKMVSLGLKKRKIDESLQSFLASMVGVSLKILLLISIAGMLGIETTSFVAVIGALGLAVGLALQGSLSNFAGGVLILVFKPFKVGDLIESGSYVGHVLEIQIFNTILLTPDHKTIILANGAVSNSTIVNLSRHGNIRVDITVPIALENDIQKTRTVAMEVLQHFDGVLKFPEASVNVSKIADGMISLSVLPYATVENYWSVYYGVQEKLKEAFEKNGIESPVVTQKVFNYNV